MCALGKLINAESERGVGKKVEHTTKAFQAASAIGRELRGDSYRWEGKSAALMSSNVRR